MRWKKSNSLLPKGKEIVLREERGNPDSERRGHANLFHRGGERLSRALQQGGEKKALAGYRRERRVRVYQGGRGGKRTLFLQELSYHLGKNAHPPSTSSRGRMPPALLGDKDASSLPRLKNIFSFHSIKKGKRGTRVKISFVGEKNSTASEKIACGKRLASRLIRKKEWKDDGNLVEENLDGDALVKSRKKKGGKNLMPSGEEKSPAASQKKGPAQGANHVGTTGKKEGKSVRDRVSQRPSDAKIFARRGRNSHC